MQVTFIPGNAPEARLVATFFMGYAELLDGNVPTVPAAAEVKQVDVVETTTRKNTRGKKTEPVATNTDQASSTESPATVAGKDTSATGVEQADASGSSETAEPVTHDTLRLLYGQLVQAGKRDGVVAAVKSFGVNAIKDIPADKLEEVHAKMKAVA